MYTFKNTEINNKKASEFETKSLLYLLGMREDSDHVDVITVDCFNDVTGANLDFSLLWDVQSKNRAVLTPALIGESLFTLYSNYISRIDFYEYILFIPQLNRDYLLDKSLNVYGYDNIGSAQKKGIERKLKQKINKDDSGIVPSLFEDFLCNVLFVEDCNKACEYVKKLSRFENKRSVSEKLYESIFNEIRDKQTALKNSYIENETIEFPSDVLIYNRHITKVDINTLVINRLLGLDVFSFNAIPFSFFSIISDMNEEEVKDLIDDCNANLSRAFFDKNSCKYFWGVSENIIDLVRRFPDENIVFVYDRLAQVIDLNSTYLNKNTIQYMISLVKTGMKNAS